MVLGKTLSTVAIGVALFISGCGGSSSAPPSSATADQRRPEEVMAEFLDAIKHGDDKKASALLTDLARKKTTEMEMVVAPPGSETASFKILESEIEGSEAQVATEWTDLDLDGTSHTDPIVWLMRNEASGWRISGMATRIYADMDRIILNFEDPVDMLRKQQEAEAEIARREAAVEVNEIGTADADSSTVR